MPNTAVNSGREPARLLVAAHAYTKEDLSRGKALISLMVLVSAGTQLNFSGADAVRWFALHHCAERNHVSKVHVYPDHVFAVLHVPPGRSARAGASAPWLGTQA
jgi:hypothetical protein